MIFPVDVLEGFSMLENQSIDMIITDPPYGINFKSNRQSIDRKRSVKREGDFSVRDEFFTQIKGDEELPISWLNEAHRVLKDGCALYIFCHWSKWSRLESAVNKARFNVKNMIVLNKSNHGMGDLKGSYAPKHELLLFASKGRHILNFDAGREKDVWDVKIKFTGSKKLHPNEKPLSWHTKAILNSSKENGVVLDPFCGSGSGLVEAKKLKRQFIGFEIDPKFWQEAVRRTR